MNIQYSYVSKQESSMADANFILAQTNLHKRTFLPGRYEDSLLLDMSTVDWFKNVSNEIIEKLYICYYPDFLMYNYSVDQFLK